MVRRIQSGKQAGEGVNLSTTPTPINTVNQVPQINPERDKETEEDRITELLNHFDLVNTSTNVSLIKSFWDGEKLIANLKHIEQEFNMYNELEQLGSCKNTCNVNMGEYNLVRASALSQINALDNAWGSQSNMGEFNPVRAFDLANTIGEANKTAVKPPIHYYINKEFPFVYHRFVHNDVNAVDQVEPRVITQTSVIGKIQPKGTYLMKKGDPKIRFDQNPFKTHSELTIQNAGDRGESAPLPQYRHLLQRLSDVDPMDEVIQRMNENKSKVGFTHSNISK